MLNQQQYEELNRIYRDDLSKFIRRTFSIVSSHSVYKHNWHIDCLAEYLEACRKGQIKRLIINWPPRFLKSIGVSVAFPAFLLGHNPQEQILCASYSKDLAMKHGTDCRSVIQTEWYKSVFPNVKLADDQNTKSKFKTTENGVRYSVGVGGTITGEGGNCFDGKTLILTTKGYIAIETIVKNSGAFKIISYNHLLKREEIKSIIASKVSISNDLYEIQTNKGFSIRCTGDHNIYIEGFGYVEARKLKPGMPIHYGKQIPYNEQCFNESNNSMPFMSYETSSRHIGEIESITKVSNGGDIVYDIQVADNHNFFANGILVHNCIIIDDPIKTSESTSKLVRDSTNEWFGQTAYTRLNDKRTGCIILIMQRLHQNDLTGFLLEQGGWEHLKIQMVAEEDKKYSIGSFSKQVKEGDLLSPNQINEAEIDQLKRTIGSYNWSGQFQQNPSPTGGGEFRREWLKFYKGKLAYHNMNCYIMVDPANSKKKSSDYTAMVVIGLGTDDNIYVLDIVRDKLNLRERQERLFELQAKYRPKTVLYEKYGMSADIEAIKEAMEYLNHRFTITEVGGAISKEDRIRRLIPHFYNGIIYLPENLIKADWNGKPIDIIEEFIEQEYLAFPVAKNDDIIDSLSRLFDTTLQWPKMASFDYNAFSSGFPSMADKRQ